MRVEREQSGQTLQGLPRSVRTWLRLGTHSDVDRRPLAAAWGTGELGAEAGNEHGSTQVKALEGVGSGRTVDTF